MTWVFAWPDVWRRFARGTDVAEPIQIRQVTSKADSAWLVTSAGQPEHLVAEWTQSACRVFSEQVDVASVSVVTSLAPPLGTGLYHATHPSLPVCFVNPRIEELIGFSASRTDVRQLIEVMEAASLRGLPHYWLKHEHGPVAATALSRFGAGVVGRVRVPESLQPIAVGIDASWLLGGESGAQVFAIEMIKALATRPEIARIVLLSDTGGVPASLAGLPTVSGETWARALNAPGPTLDVLHRPYQPGADTSLERYRQVARSVVITVLDFIAYDNARYHDTFDDWRKYCEAFDARVCAADQIVGISESVARRVQSQFAHRLALPVCAVPLGTDHLSVSPESGTTAAVSGIDGPFALVLGNDFAHKNRDFAVRVFESMCVRGYQGRLVLAGFHLDLGSSFGYELDGARTARDRVVRLGAVSAAQKTQLLRDADVVLYPTSSEGFGLVPFEAAALGTPTAFVGFGPLRELMPNVTAAQAWSVEAFAELALDLVRSPAAQVAQIQSAAAGLTWSNVADNMLSIYRRLMADESPWGSLRPVKLPPTPWPVESGRALRHVIRRVRNKVRRIIASR